MASILRSRSANKNQNPNVCVSLGGAGLYTFIPVISKADKADIRSGCKYAILTLDTQSHGDLIIKINISGSNGFPRLITTIKVFYI